MSPQVALHGPARTAELSGDLADGPPCGPQPGCPGSIVGRRLSYRRVEMQGRRDCVAIIRAKPAVPAAARLRVLGAERERETGQPCRASGAPNEGRVFGTALVRVVDIGVDSAARGITQLAENWPGTRISDELAKPGLVVGYPRQVGAHRRAMTGLPLARKTSQAIHVVASRLVQKTIGGSARCEQVRGFHCARRRCGQQRRAPIK